MTRATALTAVALTLVFATHPAFAAPTLSSPRPATRPMARQPRYGHNIPVPSSFRVTLSTDKREYFLGENVLVLFRVTNTGAEPFSVETGGDYRGSPRHLRYIVTLKSVADGKAAPDPYPHPMCMGGLGGPRQIKPGAAFEESVPLMRYAHPLAAGEYIVQVSHDFGWDVPDNEESPAVAETKIKFVMPTPEQAAGVVQDMIDRGEDQGRTAGQRWKDYRDLSVLRYGVYLPILEKQLAAAPADEKLTREAMEALARMPDPAAGEALLKMAEKARGAAELARYASALDDHLPATAEEKQYAPGARFPSDFSFRPRFAAAVRKLANRLLDSGENDSIMQGSLLVMRVGEADDLPTLVRAIDTLVPRTVNEPRISDIFSHTRDTIANVRRAASEVMGRGAKPPEDPKTPGEIAVYLTSLTDEKALPPIAAQRVSAWVGDKIPYIQESALDATKDTLRPAVRAKLPALIEDADINVRMSAAHLAQRSKEASCRDALLRRLAAAASKWEIDAMKYALDAIGAQPASWRALANRLDETNLTQGLIDGLTRSVMRDTNGSSWNGTIDPGEAKRVKAAWLNWLEAHAQELREGRRFSANDPDLPVELCPKNFSVMTTQGSWPKR